jgi:hypothetical protein
VHARPACRKGQAHIASRNFPGNNGRLQDISPRLLTRHYNCRIKTKHTGACDGIFSSRIKADAPTARGINCRFTLMIKLLVVFVCAQSLIVNVDAIEIPKEYWFNPHAEQSKNFTAEQKKFLSYANMFCLKMGGPYSTPQTPREFRKKILDEMNGPDTVAYFDDFWKVPACEPRYIASTMSPLIHFVAENSTDRLFMLKELCKYYLEVRKRPDIWAAIVNVKNTEQQTSLDYMEYILIHKRNIPEELPGIADYIDFLCANGGVYAFYQKKCGVSSGPGK